MKEKFGFNSIYTEVNESHSFIDKEMNTDINSDRWHHSVAAVALRNVTTAIEKTQESIIDIALKIDAILKSGSNSENKLSKIEGCLRELEKLLEGTTK